MTAVAIPPGPEWRAARLAAALAGVIARPLDHLDGAAAAASAAAALAPLPVSDVAALAARPAFRRPLNRAASRGLGLHALPLDAAFLARLAAAPRTRLAALLATQPAGPLGEAARLAAAAVLHRRVTGLVLRTDRARIRTALGESGFAVAVHEAPLLHADLAELDDGGGAAAFAADLDPEAARAHLAGTGLGLLARFLAAVEPGLAALFRHRLPPGAEPRDPLPGSACDHLTRLLRRRMDPWTALIG
ncbi:hypothetical protein [Methylobacterium oryzihabitans]|uniref:hypothetical protein n=1 Tax=Methylobacterium oryzihabitans TaxID=2499852 RepID=UPI0016524F4A|nr:hypothetical protein [Methylobacterium oryzihabitans]